MHAKRVVTTACSLRKSKEIEGTFWKCKENLGKVRKAIPNASKHGSRLPVGNLRKIRKIKGNKETSGFSKFL